MLLPATPLFRRRRGGPKKAASTPPTPPQPLMLVSASYESETPALLTLVFDRAINIGAINGAAIIVDDAQQSFLKYNATGGAVLLDPTTLRLTLVSIDDPSGDSIVLSASAASGIVAVDDGGTWEGCTNLLLPFP